MADAHSASAAPDAGVISMPVARLTLAELAAGRITVDDIRNTSPATRALCVGHSGTVGDGQTAGGDSMPRSAPPVFFEQYAHARAYL